MIPIILFAGIIVNLDTSYVWIRWIQYISPLRYGLEVLHRVEFEDKDMGA